MPKRIPAVTRKDVVLEATMMVMNTLAGAIVTTTVVSNCDPNEDGSPHYCMWNLAADKGWLQKVDSNLPTGQAYLLTADGADAFCRQVLSHSTETGDVIDLINELFDKYPYEYNAWKEILQSNRIAQSLS